MRQVSEELFRSPDGVVLLADRLDRAELEHGLAMRFGSRHAGAEIVRGWLSEMFLHLFEQTLISAAAGCEVQCPMRS
jgi:hypothetical protein